MPILLSVNNYYYKRDGSEVLFFEKNRLFEEMGWQVIPFSMKHRENVQTAWSTFFVTEVDYGQPYTLFEKLIRIPKVIYSLESKVNVQRLLDTVTPDICHCHSIYHHLSPSILAVIKKNKIPIVMTLHDLKIACPAYHMYNAAGLCEKCKDGHLSNVITNKCIKGSLLLSSIVFIESALHGWLKTYQKNVDCFIVPSYFYKQKLKEWGWPEEKIEHVPNFVDLNRYAENYQPGKHFLYFGRLSPEKGLITLIHAAKMSNSKLYLAGDGPQRSELQRLALDTGADVTFLGHLRDDELWAAVRSSRATVIPSEWYENAPMSIIESYALGKPVVGADMGGIPEMIAQNETGLLFKSGSVEDLAEALNTITGLSDSIVSDMGRAAREMVATIFSFDNYREKVMDVYRDLNSGLSVNR